MAAAFGGSGRGRSVSGPVTMVACPRTLWLTLSGSLFARYELVSVSYAKSAYGVTGKLVIGLCAPMVGDRVRRGQQMLMGSWGRRIAVSAAAAGVLLGAAAGTAAAWPTPLTSDQIRYVNSARASFPGADDDTLMLVGSQMCRGLYTGKHAPDVIGEASASYGISPEQAAGVLSAARGSLCTQAPG